MFQAGSSTYGETETGALLCKRFRSLLKSRGRLSGGCVNGPHRLTCTGRRGCRSSSGSAAKQRGNWSNPRSYDVDPAGRSVRARKPLIHRQQSRIECFRQSYVERVPPPH